MADHAKLTRDVARQHLDAIEAALVQVNGRLASTKQKFERAFRDRPDPADPRRISFELEQAAFELERRRLTRGLTRARIPEPPVRPGNRRGGTHRRPRSYSPASA